MFPLLLVHTRCVFSSTFLSAEKRSKGLFHQITKTHGTVIGVSSGIVLVLLIISILVQMKQPRKKVANALVSQQRPRFENDGRTPGGALKGKTLNVTYGRKSLNLFCLSVKRLICGVTDAH